VCHNPTVATYFLTLASLSSYLVDEPLGLITLRPFDLITQMRTRRGLRRSASLPPIVAVAVDETSDVNRTAHAALNGSGSANTMIRDKHRTGPPDRGPLAEIPLVKAMDWSRTSGWTRSDAMSHDH
jgi:hypothetical protein